MTRFGSYLPHAVVAVVVIGAAAVLAQPATRVQVVGEVTFADPAITESSGLIARDRRLLTVNDSGDTAVLYAVDAESGRTVGRTTYTTDAVLDVEALAPGRDGTVWVGDIGDNREAREFVSVYAVPGRSVSLSGDATVTAPRFDLVYPDGPHDAEALLSNPRTGRLYVVSKGLFRGQVYAAPLRLRADQPNEMTEVGPARGTVTDGSFTRDGRHVLLRDYDDAWVVEPGRWKAGAEMALPSQKQGETLAVTDDPGEVLVSSEGTHAQVLTVELADELRSALGTREPRDRVRTAARPRSRSMR